MARRKKTMPAPPMLEENPQLPQTARERAQEDHLIECLWRMAAWHSGFGRAVCDRAAASWAGQPPVCVTWETHVPIRDFLHAWAETLPPDAIVTRATFRHPTHAGGPTPLDPDTARARLAAWLSDGTLMLRPCR